MASNIAQLQASNASPLSFMKKLSQSVYVLPSVITASHIAVTSPGDANKPAPR